jgi:translation elongation factor EF-1beta
MANRENWYDAVKIVCKAININSMAESVKFVLMNTAGNQNRDLEEPISFGQKVIIGIIRLLLPPHTDNENAADYLRINIGQENAKIKWVVVRPDSLIDSNQVTPYETFNSPTRSAIFDPGKTSRINVGHFMASLMLENALWNKWKGKMPVLYNVEI